MKRLLVCGLMVAALAMSGVRANAATLTIVDTGKTHPAGDPVDATWTLTTATGCTVCATTLSVTFAAASEYIGTYLNAFQFVVTQGNMTSVAKSGTPFWDATGYSGEANGDWAIVLDAGVSNGSDCGANPSDNTCGYYAAALPTQGFGAITGGQTITWNFNVTYASALPTANLTGNIRGEFNTSDGKNYNIFSPSGGSFDGDGGGGRDGDGGNSPEPATLMLFGLALSGAGFRMRRSRQ